VIGKVVRGQNARRLLYYLYGPGRANEHTDDRARWFHVEAASARAHDRAGLVEAARDREDLAARLSFARPGEPIRVVDE
jgi:hypothetical protein